MGADYELSIELISPNAVERTTNIHITGNVAAIGIVAQRAISSELSAISEEDSAETILYKEANRYIDRWNQAEDELASLMHLEVTRPIPTVVTVGGVIDVTYLLDMPHGFEWKGVFVDASLRATSTVASHDSKVTSERQKTFMRLSALQGSILENKIFEDDFQVDSVSTAELLQLAATTQQEVVMIDKTNIASLLPTLSVDDNVREDISNSVNQGLIVRIPRIDITHQDWSGIGYIKENPSTGEAGYMLSGMIAGGMTTMMPEEWVEYRLVSTLKAPFTGEPSKGPAATIVKVLPTDRQSGIVGTQLGQQLMVLVQDRQGLPVEGAKVTFRVIAGGGNFGKNLLQQPQETLEVKTGKDGVARARFLLGTKTSDNPMYTKIDAQDEFVTQIGLNLVTATTGSIVIQQPFNLYGTPDAPFEIKKIYGDGAVGLANNPAGSLVAKVVDKYGNPISNQSIRMKTVGINPRYAGTALPPQPKPLEFYDRKTCTNPYPLYGDCASSPEVTVTTQYYGAIATAVFGDTVATRYSVEASVVNSGLLPTYFELYTSGFRAIDNYIPPGVYLRYLQPVNDSGQPINASRAGTPLKGPLSAEFVLMRDDVKLEGPTSCSSGEGSCWNLVTTGKVITEKITNGTVNFSATAGGGTAGATENLHNGKYRAPYTTGPSPSVNLVEAGGTATITVPKVLYNPMVTGTVIPSFGADYSGSTKPLAIKEYRDTSLQCSNGTCKLPEASITLKGGQQVIFYAAEPMQQATGSEQKATYTLFGVDVPVVIEPKVMFLNEKGYSYADTKIKYTILPPEYNASIVDLDIFKDGAWQGYLVGGASQGSDSATITAGSVLDVNSNYTVQAVLNRGSDVEITSSEIALPIGQFRMVADDDGITPMEGAVTDGAARLRLQLIAKHNREAFSNLIWRVYDSQLKNDPIANSNTVRGTLVDGSNNPTEALYVTFNADGIAEAVYRAPATFVRWGTSQESNDKDIPERQIQPTLDLTDSLLADGEMLPAIKLKRPPVVLVHGLWGNAKAWDEFEPKLNDRSQYSIARVDYSESGQVSSIVKHAAKLRTTINTKLTDLIREGFASSKIDIIAHSMGGLLTREFCKQQKERFNNDCNDVIRRFITIATPHRGSELADLLLVYRGPNTRDFFSTNQDCLRTLDSFERGSKIRVIGPYERSVEPHPLTPKDGAIDDLATGALPPQLPQGLTSKGRWKDYPALSQTLSAHTIVGLTGANADGYDIEIFGLWRYIISRCGFTRVAIFGAEAETNDRIVKQTSQIGGVIDQHSTKVYDTDHFSVRNSIKTIDRIRELIDEPRDSELFTK
ncbi:MAG TPA: hypothetical protein DDX85_06320 [Nitrospiraceae bacterium]|nr:hypothetical protein [Nitrospiraceae bacterium]